MLLIVGLGNPGFDYSSTRHNIGFMVIDEVAKEFHLKLSKGNGEYLLGTKIIRREPVILAKPMTYMNNSGIAVREIIEQYKIDIKNILIVVDDFNIPLGTIRIRMRGSSGGHNGLYSIIYHLETDEFSRLRCGIGSETMPKSKSELANFVLSPFTENEKEDVIKLVSKAKNAVLIAIENGLETAICDYKRSNFN